MGGVIDGILLRRNCSKEQELKLENATFTRVRRDACDTEFGGLINYF